MSPVEFYSMSDQVEQPAKVRLFQRIALWGYLCFHALLRCLPMRFWCRAGRCVGWAVWLCSASRRRIVARNLRIILGGELRSGELAPMVRENMKRTCMNFLAAAKIGVVTEDELDAAVRIVGGDVYENAGLNGRTGIACIPHAGNWEILSRIRSHFPKVGRYGAMYRRMSNPLLEKLVYSMRTAYGCEMFSKEDGLRAVFKLAKGGGLVGVLSDQFTQEGAFLPYFGKVTGTTYLPALIYKRCRGTLFTIYTRNTSLGHWDAVMNRTIDLPDPQANIYELTFQINKALAERQRESVLDGFWLHHRWKATRHFAPPQPPEVMDILKREKVQPFRIVVVLPESFEESLLVVPFLRALHAVRCDIQITVACPDEQRDFWRMQKEVAHVVTTDASESSLSRQLDADAIYNEGPFDYVFLLDCSRKTWRCLRPLMPVYISGFDDHPCAGHRAFRMRTPRFKGGPPRHRVESFLDILRAHFIPCDQPEFFEPECSKSAEREGRLMFAPFSTLGPSTEWPREQWEELFSLLPEDSSPLLVALSRDAGRAEEWAHALGVESICRPPAEFDMLINAKDILVAVDGLIPMLASHWGARCIVLMAGRLPECWRPLGKRHTVLHSHRPCHPCYCAACDREIPCIREISPAVVAEYV
ncbi:MAG: hypothetical protein LUG84_04180 [Akkermansiaceae bacterium]|nr:hypothetical protein [Akkermansiaceae bacterium]